MAAKKGEAHHLAKLTPDLVRKIRALRKGGMTHMQIVEAINWHVAPSTVRALLEGRTWTHVE